MNIFFLDWDPLKAAEYHCDRHVIKMITETSQMISTCHFVLDNNTNLMKPTHINHPCNAWLRKSNMNYRWTQNLLKGLLNEYDKRYDKPDKFVLSRKIVKVNLPKNIIYTEMTTPALAMPNECKTECPVDSYRNYYKLYKSHFAKWKSNEPEWWN